MSSPVDPGRFYLRTLGTVELVDSTGMPVEPLAAHPKSLALLAFIVLSCRGEPCSRDTLLAHFWPGLSVKKARHALRQALYEVRQALGEGVLEVRGRHGVMLSRTRFGADVLDLYKALEEERLDDVAALVRGELLPGLHVKGAREFDAWLTEERETLARRVSTVLWSKSRQLAQSGDLDAAVLRGRQAFARDPYNEGGLRDLMAVLMDAGRSMEALRLYRAARDRALQVGMKLGKETEALAERCRRGFAASKSSDPPPATPDPGADRVPGAADALEGDMAAAEVGDPVVADGVKARRRWVYTRAYVAAALLIMVVSFAHLLSFTAGTRSEEAMRINALVDGGREAIPVLVAPAPEAQDQRATAMVLEALAMLLSTDEEVGFAAVEGASPTAWPAARTAVLVSATSGGADHWRARIRVLVRGRAGAAQSAEIGASGLRALLEAAVDSLWPAMGLDDGSARWDLLPANDTALAAFARARQLAAQGHHHAAVAAFERATGMDRDFALGWYYWATMPEGSFDAPARRDDGRRVDDFAGRLPRAQATVIEAQQLYRAGQPHQAEALLRSLLARHPRNADATYQLAEVLLHYNPIRGRPLHEPLQLLERGLQLQPGRPEALYHVSQLYLLQGDTAAFDGVSNRLLEAKAADRLFQVRLVKARVHGDADAWHDDLAALASDREFTILSAANYLAVYAGDVGAALEVLAILTSPDRDPAVRSRAHVFMAELLAAQGRSSSAVRQFDAAMKLDAEHGASRAAHLMASGVLPLTNPDVEALARRIIDAPSLPSRDVPDWLNVEADLRPWLEQYARAAARLALGDSGEARLLLRRLKMLDASRGARLLAVSLETLLADPPAESSLPWWGVTPTEGILSPFYSLAATRLAKGRRALEAGRVREAEFWFASLLDQSIPDLAFAQMALQGRARALDGLGEADSAAMVRNRLARLQERGLFH